MEASSQVLPVRLKFDIFVLALFLKTDHLPHVGCSRLRSRLASPLLPASDQRSVPGHVEKALLVVIGTSLLALTGCVQQGSLLFPPQCPLERGARRYSSVPVPVVKISLSRIFARSECQASSLCALVCPTGLVGRRQR